MTETLYLLMLELTAKVKDYPPTHDCLGQATDSSNRLRGPGQKLFNLVAVTNGTDHIGACPRVAAVDDPTEFLAFPEEGVGLINQ
jgi:hypothetical protein